MGSGNTKNLNENQLSPLNTERDIKQSPMNETLYLGKCDNFTRVFLSFAKAYNDFGSPIL